MLNIIILIVSLIVYVEASPLKYAIRPLYLMDRFNEPIDSSSTPRNIILEIERKGNEENIFDSLINKLTRSDVSVYTKSTLFEMQGVNFNHGGVDGDDSMLKPACKELAKCRVIN